MSGTACTVDEGDRLGIDRRIGWTEGIEVKITGWEVDEVRVGSTGCGVWGIWLWRQ